MATKNVSSYRTPEANSTKQTPLLCYEVWYTGDNDNRQMVAAYWDVLVAWRVMEAINKSVYGNLGVAEVAVANGTEEWLPYEPNDPNTTGEKRPRTDVLNEQGIRSQPNEQKYEAAKREFEELDNDQAEPQWKPKPWAVPSAGDMTELVNPEQDVSNTEYPEYDMDGTRYHPQPTIEDQDSYEAYQRQAVEWAKQGLCMSCGAKPPLTAGYCQKCMDEFSACAGDAQG